MLISDPIARSAELSMGSRSRGLRGKDALAEVGVDDRRKDKPSSSYFPITGRFLDVSGEGSLRDESESCALPKDTFVSGFKATIWSDATDCLCSDEVNAISCNTSSVNTMKLKHISKRVREQPHLLKGVLAIS